MTRFVLLPGAGGDASYWHRVVPLLQEHGHEPIAVDLPGPDESAGLPEYTDCALAAIGDHRDAVLVAQSMSGFLAPIVCAHAPVGLVVLVNAMIPLPGETPGEWWDNTGQETARRAAADAGGYPTELDLGTYFLHDIPSEILAAADGRDRPEADIAFGQPCEVAWPDVTTRIVAAGGDRFFPTEFQRRVARERLGVDVDEVPGGHLVALSHPHELTTQLVRYLDARG